jgi:menaquinone-dependent protoporphyrinogen oxidase
MCGSRKFATIAPMTDVLITYTSTHGHTAKIAVRVARAVRLAGAEPHTFDLGAGANPAPADYDLVVAGASIHNGHHQRAMVEWARHHASSLNMVPSAFFSVSLTAADDSDESRTHTQQYLDEFLDDTGWIPAMTKSFAGALQYREYDFSTRLIMRLVMAAGHHPTNIEEDVDYTVWDAVDALATQCLELLSAPARHDHHGAARVPDHRS